MNEPKMPVMNPNEDVETVAKALAESAANNEDITLLREIQEKPNDNTTVTEGTVKAVIKDDGTAEYARGAMVGGDGELKESSLGITDIDQLETVNERKIYERSKSDAKAMELTDDEAENIAGIIIQYRKNPKMNCYAAMIPSMRSRITKLCIESGSPISDCPKIAKYMISQFASGVSSDEEFVDIERSLEEAIKMPSVVDIYMEHVDETMNVKLPAMADAIRAEDPEKADKLMAVCEQYTSAFLFARLRELYDTNTRLRKLVRRDYSVDKMRTLGQTVNELNSRTKFKMPDCSKIPSVVVKLMQDHGYYGLDNADVCKFCVLIFGAASYIKLDDVVDASWYYYTLKNISMMAFLGEGLSDFSAELISNMRVTMHYIRMKEDEFYADIGTNNGKSHKQKRSVRKRNQR